MLFLVIVRVIILRLRSVWRPTLIPCHTDDWELITEQFCLKGELEITVACERCSRRFGKRKRNKHVRVACAVRTVGAYRKHLRRAVIAGRRYRFAVGEYRVAACAYRIAGISRFFNRCGLVVYNLGSAYVIRRINRVFNVTYFYSAIVAKRIGVVTFSDTGRRLRGNL